MCGQQFKIDRLFAWLIWLLLKKEHKKARVFTAAFPYYYCFLVLFLVHFSALFDFSMFTIFALIIKSFIWRINIINVDVPIVKMLFFKLFHRFDCQSVGRQSFSGDDGRPATQSDLENEIKNWELDKLRIIWNAQESVRLRPPRKRVLLVCGRLRGTAPRGSSCAPGK